MAKKTPNDSTLTHNLTNWGAIDQLKHEQLIPNETAETLKIKTPQFHMLPKIHTIGNPGKPVVSSIGSHNTSISNIADYYMQPLVNNMPP